MSARRLLIAILAWPAIVPMAAACPLPLSIQVENRRAVTADELRVASANRADPRGPVQTSGNQAPQGGLAAGASAVVMMPHCNGPFTLIAVFADGSRRTYPDLMPRPALALALR